MSYFLPDHLEALLFYKGEGVLVRDLACMTGVEEGEVKEGLQMLKERLTGGVRLILDTNRALLATAPEYTASIELLVKEELGKELGKAGSEVLAIVLYMGPITRTRIDYIRGVNSTFALRHLLVRGLVEKIPNPDDSRSMLYQPTLELLAHLGVGAVEDLPDYEAVRKELMQFENRTDTVSSDMPKEDSADDTDDMSLDDDTYYEEGIEK
jgi:segregation and condensation protein B